MTDATFRGLPIRWAPLDRVVATTGTTRIGNQCRVERADHWGEPMFDVWCGPRRIAVIARDALHLYWPTSTPESVMPHTRTASQRMLSAHGIPMRLGLIDGVMELQHTNGDGRVRAPWEQHIQAHALERNRLITALLTPFESATFRLDRAGRWPLLAYNGERLPLEYASLANPA